MGTMAMTNREYYDFIRENTNNRTITHVSNVGDDGYRKIYHVFFPKTYEWVEIIVRG